VTPELPPDELGAWAPPPEAPMPGVIPLRPLSVVEIFDGALGTVRQHPRATLLPGFVVALVIGVLELLAAWLTVDATRSLVASDPSQPDFGALTAALAPSLVVVTMTAVLQLLAVVVLVGWITVVVGEAVLGRPVTLTATWRRVHPHARRLAELSLLIALIVVPLGLALLVPAVWVGVGLCLATAVCVMEGSGASRSLRRSWLLVRGTWWRTFGSLVLTAVIAGAVTALIAVPFSIPELVAPSVDPETFEVDGARFLLNTTIATIGRVVAGTFTLPFGAAVVSLLYLDRRMRHDGLHLALVRSLDR
jgi:hypothetical protein